MNATRPERVCSYCTDHLHGLTRFDGERESKNVPSSTNLSRVSAVASLDDAQYLDQQSLLTV